MLFDAVLAPSAVIAANNPIALGVICSLDQRGLAVGAGITLACGDELPNGSRSYPSVTVLIQAAYEIGVTAALVLFEQIERRTSAAPRHVMLPARMLIRGDSPTDLDLNPLKR